MAHSPAKAYVIPEDIDVRGAKTHGFAHHRRGKASHRARGCRVAQKLGGDVGNNLIDQASREGAAVQARSTLKQHRVDTARTQGL